MFPSMFVIVISLLNASTCAPSAAVNRNDPGGHRCYSCASVDKPYQCNVTTQCRPDEQCYTDEYSTNHGTSIFSVGCRRISECYAEIVRRSDFSGRLKCDECCHGNLCNSGGCSAGVYMLDNTLFIITPAQVDVCYSCRFIDYPRHCENYTRCRADEHCYIEKVLTQNFYIKYSLGCVDRAECETLRQFGMSIGKRDTAISTMYASCCNGDKCNDVWFAKGITSDTPRTSLATPKHHPTTQSSYVTTSSSMTKDTNVVDATNGMSSTSPSKTKDTTVVHTTSGMSCTSPLKTEDRTIVDTTNGAPSTSPSKTKDTTVVDRTSGMSSTIPSMTKDTTVVHTTIGMPSLSPSKNKDATFVDTTSFVSSTSPSKTKHTTIVDTTSGAPSTSPSVNKNTAAAVVETSGASSTSPSKAKDTTVVDRTSGMSSTSPSMTKDTTVVHTSGAPSTSPSKTEDTTVFHTTSWTHFSLIPKSSLYTFSTRRYTVTISPSTSTTPSMSTHDSHHPGLLCSRCDRVTDPLDCTYMTICEKDEVCHIAQFVTSQGNLFYKLGCKAEQECQALYVGRRQNGDTVFDERCCTIHPECNRDLFKTSKDLSCGSCKDLASPSDCEKVTTCRSNEVCERTVYLSDEFFLRYTLQCIQRDYCGGRVLHRTLSDDEYTDLCCDTNYCNMAVNKK
ncbi:serine-rich adhesin for platelets-like [Haliotis cracherodii]|uniref:serine-rich adhesin for platelets-like n=1 Tax=Haliotis cracherodii TaxID=6455 RepID=UPI0039EAE043